MQKKVNRVKRVIDTINDWHTCGKKSLVLLIDPDKENNAESIAKRIQLALTLGIEMIFVGGSLASNDQTKFVIQTIKNIANIPVVLFPGGVSQVRGEADAILFLSLISGRNPDFLIGQHVVAAPVIKKYGLESISTGYLLIGNEPSSAAYVSNTSPIPEDKHELATATALAGEMMGQRLLFLDAGSGALNPISAKTIKLISKTVSLPVIVGGGIKKYGQAYDALMAGADVLVIGNAAESNPSVLKEIANAVKDVNEVLQVH